MTDNSIPEDAASDDADSDDARDSADADEEEFSLEELGAAYARAAAQHDPESFAVASPDADNDHDGQPEAVADDFDEMASLGIVEQDDPATPHAIIEGALFVGHPRNEPCTLERLSSLIRDVNVEDVREIVDELNESYRQADQALRIVPDEHGFKMTIAPEIESVRRSFLGKVREARLSQVMIEVLSLVAYQPGISSQKVQDQRGRDCGPMLNQLVRRRLLELKREVNAVTNKNVNCYYPTERFLSLFGLESLDDLPQVDESFAG